MAQLQTINEPVVAATENSWQPLSHRMDSTEGVHNSKDFLISYARGNIDIEISETPPFDDICFKNGFRAPQHPDEINRTQELYASQILTDQQDINVQLNLDTYAKVTAKSVGCKYCFIHFIDKTYQHILGKNLDTFCTDMKKEFTLCSHTILRKDREPFVVPNMTKDWRFKNLSYVVEDPHFKFYAGIPLQIRGQNIGVVCVLEQILIDFTKEMKDTLIDMGCLIENALELHRDRSVTALRERMQNSISSFTKLFIERGNEDLKKESAAAKDEKVDSNPSSPLSPRSSERPLSLVNSYSWRPRKSVLSFDTPSKHDFGSPETEISRESTSDSGLCMQECSSDNNTVLDSVEEDVSIEHPFEVMCKELKTKGLYDVPENLFYHLACTMMGETLDIEGVKIISLKGDLLGSFDSSNKNTLKVDSLRQPGVTATDRSTSSNKDKIKVDGIYHSFSESDSASSINSPGLEDNSREAEICLQASFIQEFLLEHPNGCIYNSLDIPAPLKNFLKVDAAHIIFTTIYDFSNFPFAICCAYTKRDSKAFDEYEKLYVEAFSGQLLSEITKRRIATANRAKQIFISSISHELRSPMHGILASAEFLSDTSLDPFQRTLTDTIESCGKTLLDVINHVLDFSKISNFNQGGKPNGKVGDHLAEPKLLSSISNSQDKSSSLVDNVAYLVEQVMESCATAGQFFTFQKQFENMSTKDSSGTNTMSIANLKVEELPVALIINLDAALAGKGAKIAQGALQRVIMNLTGNALKYTQKGWVNVNVNLLEDEEDGENKISSSRYKVLHIVVQDTGRGISSQFLQKNLFNPFSQEDSLKVGTGLGLSIVKDIVDKIEGTIHVSSEVGKGTCIDVRLPVIFSTEVPQDDLIVTVRSKLRGRNVYVTGFDLNIESARLYHESIVYCLKEWFGANIVTSMRSAVLIITNECLPLLMYLQQTSPQLSDKSPLGEEKEFDFNRPDRINIPEAASEYDHADKPMVVLCSNVLQYELFSLQAELGRVIDFCSKPCGPYKLAKSINFCLEKASGHTLDTKLWRRSFRFPKLGSLRSHSKRVPLKGAVRYAPQPGRLSSDNQERVYIQGDFFQTFRPPINNPSKSSAPLRSETSRGNRSRSNSQKEFEEEIQGEIEEKKNYERVNVVVNQEMATVVDHNARESMSSSKPVSPKTLNVLICEDNSVNSLILSTYCKMRGHSFVVAENGQVGLDEFKKDSDGFDVVLMGMYPHPTITL